MWHSSLRLLVEQVPVAQRARIQAEHLAEVTALAGADGLWLDVAVHCVHGRVPVPGG